MRLFLCAVLAAAALPAAAQELDALMAHLSAPEGQNGQLAALAACIAGRGDPETTAALFTAAGWTRSDDSEMGTIDLLAPSPGLSAMVSAEGGSCEVASGSIGTPKAGGTVSRLAIEGQVAMGVADGPDCGGMTLGDAVVVVTSTGQDPSCSSETDSVIRVMFPK